MKLVRGGSVSNGVYPVELIINPLPKLTNLQMLFLKKNSKIIPWFKIFKTDPV